MHTPTLTSPLPDTRCREINQALGLLIQLEAELERAGRCGYDSAPDIAELQAMRAGLEAWKKEYFPTRA